MTWASAKPFKFFAFLLVLKRRRTQPQPAGSEVGASLLIVTASLIANWKAEIQKFAPSLSVFYAHPAETPKEELAKAAKDPAKALERTTLSSRVIRWPFDCRG